MNLYLIYVFYVECMLSVCFHNDRAITQNTPKICKNCSDDQLSYIC